MKEVDYEGKYVDLMLDDEDMVVLRMDRRTANYCGVLLHSVPIELPVLGQIRDSLDKLLVQYPGKVNVRANQGRDKISPR